MLNKQSQLFAISFIAIIMPMAQVYCQRPSYAGSRPGGLSQKDKYHLTQNSNGSTNDVANRFGGADSEAAGNTQIPFGTVQKPPGQGVLVVSPQANFQPLPNVGSTQFNNVGNRFGGPSGSSVGSSSSSNASGGVNTSTFTQTQGNLPPQQSALPLDAHGDRELVNFLNTVPVENRPFWFLNYQQIEAQRNGTGDKFTGAVSSRGSFFG